MPSFYVLPLSSLHYNSFLGPSYFSSSESLSGITGVTGVLYGNMKCVWVCVSATCGHIIFLWFRLPGLNKSAVNQTWPVITLTLKKNHHLFPLTFSLSAFYTDKIDQEWWWERISYLRLGFEDLSKYFSPIGSSYIWTRYIFKDKKLLKPTSFHEFLWATISCNWKLSYHIICTVYGTSGQTRTFRTRSANILSRSRSKQTLVTDQGWTMFTQA